MLIWFTQRLFDRVLERASESELATFRKAIPILVEAWPSISAFSTASEDVKGSFLDLLGQLRPATEAVVDIYIESLAESKVESRLAHQATINLLNGGPLGAKAVPSLVAQLQRNHGISDSGPIDSSTARMGLEALANFGPCAEEAIPLIRGYLLESNLMYRVFGARAYWNITGDAELVLPVLSKALSDEDSFWAADILKEMGPSALPAIETLKAAYENGGPAVRLRSYQALVALDPASSPDPAGIVDLLATPNHINALVLKKTGVCSGYYPNPRRDSKAEVNSDRETGRVVWRFRAISGEIKVV